MLRPVATTAYARASGTSTIGAFGSTGGGAETEGAAGALALASVGALDADASRAISVAPARPATVSAPTAIHFHGVAGGDGGTSVGPSVLTEPLPARRLVVAAVLPSRVDAAGGTSAS